MLRHKYRMSAHRGLPSVVFNCGRSQTAGDKIFRMASDDFQAFLRNIGTIPFRKPEPRTER